MATMTDTRPLTDVTTTAPVRDINREPTHVPTRSQRIQLEAATVAYEPYIDKFPSKPHKFSIPQAACEFVNNTDIPLLMVLTKGQSIFERMTLVRLGATTPQGALNDTSTVNNKTTRVYEVDAGPGTTSITQKVNRGWYRILIYSKIHGSFQLEHDLGEHQIVRTKKLVVQVNAQSTIPVELPAPLPALPMRML